MTLGVWWHMSLTNLRWHLSVEVHIPTCIWCHKWTTIESTDSDKHIAVQNWELDPLSDTVHAAGHLLTCIWNQQAWSFAGGLPPSIWSPPSIPVPCLVQHLLTERVRVEVTVCTGIGCAGGYPTQSLSLLLSFEVQASKHLGPGLEYTCA